MFTRRALAAELVNQVDLAAVLRTLVPYEEAGMAIASCTDDSPGTTDATATLHSGNGRGSYGRGWGVHCIRYGEERERCWC